MSTVRQPRLLLTTARYAPDRGGTEIHTQEVARRLRRRGIDVTVVTTATDEPLTGASWDGDVRVVRVRSWPRSSDAYFAPGMISVIRSHRPDLVHCHGYHTLVAPLVMSTALNAGIPYVITLHSGGHSSVVRHALRPVQTKLMRPLLLRAKRIIAVSRFEAELFAQRLRVDDNRIAVIPGGVELPVPAQAGDVPRDERPEPLVLSLGRVERYKGHHRVVEALPHVRRVHPDLRCRIIGSGPYEDELRRIAQRLGLADHVEIAPVPAEQRTAMAAMLRSASVVVALSEYESQGLAVQEALGLGCRVLVSDTSALAELAPHPNVRTVGAEADASEVAAAINDLLAAPPAAPPRVPSWDECVDALVGVYTEALPGVIPMT